MDDPTAPSPGQPGAPGGPSANPASTQGTTGLIDVERLADKVYELLRAEARLDRARGQRPGQMKGW
jgi:hypothetical protein